MSVVDALPAALSGKSLRVLQTIYLPDDETCFTLFEAPTLLAVAHANDQFNLGYERVVAAISIHSARPATA